MNPYHPYHQHHLPHHPYPQAIPYFAPVPMAGPSWVPGPAMAQPATESRPGFNSRFVTGAVVGAAALYLLTNEDVQRTAIRSIVSIWSVVRGGVEELKERFRDAEAELQTERATPE